VSAVDRLLAEARAALDRVGPDEAASILDAGGLLVDIRPVAQRRQFGEIPGSLVIERNVLEWRLDPAGADRLPEIIGPEHQVVVFCQEGYASSLAAASLQALGLRRATDLDGGFVAWKRAGLPVSNPTSP
jgi:rhodanese-related sulfurtransferase